MTTARVFKIENRLSKVTELPGGKTMAEAVRAADARLESLRETSIASLDGQVVRLEAFARLGSTDPKSALDGLYKVSDEIFGISCTFGLKAVSEAAYGLCDLADKFRTDGCPVWPAIDVHVEGVRLLLAQGGVEGGSVVEGLRQVRTRFLAST